MSHNPNTIKSQDELNEGGRKSDILIATIEELERTKKYLSEIKNAYIDLTTQDEYGSYYIEEAKDFVDTVGRILKEAGLLQELNK